jgi:Baseplate wedge protein gp25
MNADPTTNFLGAGPAYPLHEAPAGLPDLQLAVGVDAVNTAIAVLLRTEPGELAWDQAIGLNPDIFRHRGAQNRTKNEITDAINASLRDGEPRVASPHARVTIDSQARLADIRIDVTPIRQQVARNRVLLPIREHRDALLAYSEAAIAIQGYMDGISLGFDVGLTGGE